MINILFVFLALAGVTTFVGAVSVGLSLLFTTLAPIIGATFAFIILTTVALLMIAIVVVVVAEIID